MRQLFVCHSFLVGGLSNPWRENDVAAPVVFLFSTTIIFSVFQGKASFPRRPLPSNTQKEVCCYSSKREEKLFEMRLFLTGGNCLWSLGNPL